MKQQIEKIIANPKQLFLIDGLGALLTAFLLGIVLVQFENFFGMPADVLYLLAAIACVFMLYSFSCHFLLSKNWKPFLTGIAIANLLYCLLSFSLVCYYCQKLTIFGLLYFFGEIVIIIGLVMIEKRAIDTLRSFQ